MDAELNILSIVGNIEMPMITELDEFQAAHTYISNCICAEN